MTTNFKYVQAQDFFLSGSGSIVGATSITLKSFKAIDGATLLTMTDFGTVGYATIEPGNGTQEEQISFTGVTQNSNGTATLTGVKSVLFVEPYTETSGTVKTHAGSTTLIITNTAGYYNKFPAKANDETVTGDWTFTGQATFSNFPITPANSNASTTVKGVTKLSVAPASATDPIATGTNDPRIPIGYAVDAVGTDAYAITPSPAITAYAAGQVFTFKAGTANTGACTLNVNGLGPIDIKKDVSTALATGDILLNQIVTVVYDGTNMQLSSQQSGISSTLATLGKIIDIQTFTSTGTWTMPALAKEVMIEAIGGGGGGGGVLKDTGTNTSGGGGGGGYNKIILPASKITSPVTVTINAGGAGGIGDNNGTAGGNVTFGSYLTGYGGGGGGKGINGFDGAGGGGGGMSGAGTSASTRTAGVGGGPQGGTAGVASYFGGGGGTVGGVGALSYYGGGGGGSDQTNTGGVSVFGGGGGAAGNTAAGGVSTFGGSGGIGTDEATGGAGVAPGGGGGGTKTQNISDRTGGAGAKGQITVTTYF